MLIRSVNANTKDVSQIKKEIETLDKAVFTGRRAADAPFNKDEWHDIWTSKRYKVYIARLSKTGKIVGFMVIKRTTPKNIYIDTLGVLPAFQKSGIATRLLNEILRKHAKDKVSLHVSIKNEKAIKLYKSLAFQIACKKKNFYARADDAFYLQNLR